MWTPDSANLTCDFITTGLHQGHIVAECPDIFLGGRSNLFHKIALITCKGAYLFSKPNQILIALIGLRRANPETETFAESCSRKELL